MTRKQALHIGTFILRWGVAIVGIWWVISFLSWNDHVRAVLPGSDQPELLRLADQNARDDSLIYKVIDPRTGSVVAIPRDQTMSDPDRKEEPITSAGGRKYVVGVDLSADLKQARGLWVADNPQGKGAQRAPIADFPDYRITVPHPRVQIGVLRMLRQANVHYLVAALIIMPLTILITSFRWHELLKALDIRLTISRAFVLNMVGLFYSTFLLGSTGGDVLRAYYVARQTHHRTRAVMSVLVDRGIGVLALIILGGTMAAFQSQIPKCRQVALASAALLILVVAGLTLFYVPLLRKISGLDFIINKLPMQKQVRKAIETMHIYGRRPWLCLGALLISFPVHMVVITAAQLCGIAFGLHVNLFYYWMAVPVIVLVGSIPISPQGAGVQEYFAIMLLEPQGATVAQAFALTMSIRLTQIAWNLTGAVFVVRGGYHAPTQTEQQQMELEDEDELSKV